MRLCRASTSADDDCCATAPTTPAINIIVITAEIRNLISLSNHESRIQVSPEPVDARIDIERVQARGVLLPRAREFLERGRPVAHRAVRDGHVVGVNVVELP